MLKVPTIYIDFYFVLDVDGNGFTINSVAVTDKNNNGDEYNSDTAIYFAQTIYNDRKITIRSSVSLGLLLAVNHKFTHDKKSDKSNNTEKTNSPKTSKNVNSINLVKKGILDLDKSIYLGYALETFPYFRSYTWEEINHKGRQIVRFSADYNLAKEVSDMKKKGMVDAQSYVEDIKNVKIIFDFAINLDKTSFSLHEAQFITDQDNFTSGKDYVLHLLGIIYQGSPFVIHSLSH